MEWTIPTESSTGNIRAAPEPLGRDQIPSVKEDILRTAARSAFDFVIAHRLPALNQIVFLRASGSLTGDTIMDMDMRSAMRNGVIHRHVTLKPLVQIASLGDVNGNPITALNLFGINEIAWQRPESGVNGMNLVLILAVGLPTPMYQC